MVRAGNPSAGTENLRIDRIHVKAASRPSVDRWPAGAYHRYRRAGGDRNHHNGPV